jgi:hypothetical protein
MISSRNIHRSPSNGRSLNKNAEYRDPEAAAERAALPKKAEPPSYRRQRPLILMFLILVVTFLLGASLYLSHTGSSDTTSAAAGPGAGAPGLGPSSAPQQAWNPQQMRSKVGYDTSAITYVEFTAPGLFVPLK